MKHNLLIAAILSLLGVVLWLLNTPQNVQHEDEQTGKLDKLPDVVDFNFHIKPILSDKCFQCHGPDANKRKADLRFDVQQSAYGELPENPGKFAIVPGSPDKSEVIFRIYSENQADQMPPPESNLTMSENEKQLLKKWIEQGAVYKQHWAFEPPQKTDPPSIANPNLAANEIDNFILARLEAHSITPAPRAHGEQLIRRLSLDLTGLPPSPGDVEKFLSDATDQTYEKLVDEYLSTPAYAEHMTRQWLDVSRYADSHGYQDDSYRTMWPWRDWVIHAFQENMPYDQFLLWQLAGDLLPGATLEQVLATGFNRNHPITQEGGVIQEEYRSAYVSDRTNTFSKGLLGLTLECAKCHDHKYDPFSQKDYFSVYAFFNNVNEKGLQMDAVQAAKKKYYADAPFITITPKEIKEKLDFINMPMTEPVDVMVLNDSAPRTTFVLARGNYDAPTDSVVPSTPSSILAFPDSLPENRLGLAYWLTNSSNPLTARVFVNRLWHMLFGQGLVKTLEDFGNQGALPSHPELLDWLAVDFMDHGWNVKYLLKKIVMSSTYRQSSSARPELQEIDPENQLLARGPRFRMSAEMIRDYILSTSGLLNREIGGPSVKPYQPEGLWEETNAGNNRGILTSYARDEGPKLYRRSIYTFWKRTLPHPAMTLFDAPNRDLCEVRRQKTNTPLQALALQNDEQVLEAARVLAQKTAIEGGNDDDLIESIFSQVLIRKPDESEKDIISSYYQQNLQYFTSQPEQASQLVRTGEYSIEPTDTTRTAALMMTAQVLYNLDETITKE